MELKGPGLHPTVGRHLLRIPCILLLLAPKVAFGSWGLHWNYISPMPMAREMLAVAAVGTTIYALGGEVTSLSDALADVDAYQPDADTWFSVSPLPVAAAELAAAVLNDTIYVMGGWNRFSPPGFFAYNTTTHFYTSLPNKPAFRYGLVAAAVGGTVYAIGGTANGTATLATVEAYDPATGVWVTKAPMPTPRMRMCAVVLGGVIVVIGGTQDRSSGLATVETYDPASNSWSSAPSMHEGRSGAAAAIVNGTIFVAGGYTWGSYSGSTTEVYDPGTRRWTYAETALTSVAGYGAAAVNGSLFVIGGDTGYFGKQGSQRGQPYAVSDHFSGLERAYVYPNPVRGDTAVVRIRIDRDIKGATARVFDLGMARQMVFSGGPPAISLGVPMFGLSKLGPGVYLVQVDVEYLDGSEEKLSPTKLVIKR